MASHRLAVILRSTGQLSEEDIENMSEEEAWQWLRTNALALLPEDDGSRNGADS
jgi:hypothetical protein